jgi:hypothetical protein
VKLLSLHPGARPCLRCGYCCKQGPCPFGTADTSGRCLYLVGSGPGNYKCLIAKTISEAPGSEVLPAFGAGCCSPMNSDRKDLENEKARSSES